VKTGSFQHHGFHPDAGQDEYAAVQEILEQFDRILVELAPADRQPKNDIQQKCGQRLKEPFLNILQCFHSTRFPQIYTNNR